MTLFATGRVSRIARWRAVASLTAASLVVACSLITASDYVQLGAPDSSIEPSDAGPSVNPVVCVQSSICASRSDNTPIAYPNDTPLGACSFGSVDCTSGSPRCIGAVGPRDAEVCGDKLDDDCDGVLDNGCACTAGKTEACGNSAGLPLPCKAGTRTCGTDNVWGACTGNVEKQGRDCSSALDNDCNGMSDKSEAACVSENDAGTPLIKVVVCFPTPLTVSCASDSGNPKTGVDAGASAVANIYMTTGTCPANFPYEVSSYNVFKSPGAGLVSLIRCKRTTAGTYSSHAGPLCSGSEILEATVGYIYQNQPTNGVLYKTLQNVYSHSGSVISNAPVSSVDKTKVACPPPDNGNGGTVGYAPN